MEFTYKTRVYYEHTDAGGVVYHGKYVNFFDQSRTEWLRSRGLQQSVLREEAQVLLVVRAMEIDYLRPARLDDVLTVSCRVKDHSAVKMIIWQEIKVDKQLIATAKVTVVSVHAGRFKPMRFPQQYLQQLLTE